MSGDAFHMTSPPRRRRRCARAAWLRRMHDARHQSRSGAVRQRARHLDRRRRPRRDQCDQALLRRPREEDAGQLDQVDDRPPARRGRRRRGDLLDPRDARRRRSADDQPRQSGRRLRSRLRAEHGARGEDRRRAVELVRLRRHQRHAGVPRVSDAPCRGDATAIMPRRLPGVRDLLPLAAAYPRAIRPCSKASRADRRARATTSCLRFRTTSFGSMRDGIARDAAGRHVRCVVPRRARRGVAATRAPHGHGDDQLPFRGGWLLYPRLRTRRRDRAAAAFAARADDGAPIALALRCPAAIIVDRVRGSTSLVAEKRRTELLDTLQTDVAVDAHPRSRRLDADAIVEEDAPARFLDGVERIHDYLRAGDVFQVNLSREWRVRYALTPAPAAVYAALRAANPAPFAGLLQRRGWAIASSSPERLVEVRGDRRADAADRRHAPARRGRR